MVLFYCVFLILIKFSKWWKKIVKACNHVTYSAYKVEYSDFYNEKKDILKDANFPLGV